jgi:hypothetical protein
MAAKKSPESTPKKDDKRKPRDLPMKDLIDAAKTQTGKKGKKSRQRLRK